MIGHEAEAEDFDRVFRFRRGEQVDKRGVVAVLVEDRSATVPAIEHMVGVSGYLSMWNTRHGSSTVRETGLAQPVPFSFLGKGAWPCSFPALS